MTNTCNFCGATGLTWSENVDPSTGKMYLFNENTGQKHGKQYCESKKIARYVIENGVRWDRSDQRILNEIVNEAMRLGYRQFERIKTVEQGDFIIVKR